MKHSELLRKSVKNLYHPETNRKGTNFICRALGSSSEACEIRSLILKRLNGRVSIDAYLRDKLEVPFYERLDNNFKPTAKVQEYRMAWMLELAREYESKGM